MIGEEGEGQSYPMQERDVRNPVIKDTFEQRMKKYKERYENTRRNKRTNKL